MRSLRRLSGKTPRAFCRKDAQQPFNKQMLGAGSSHDNGSPPFTKNQDEIMQTTFKLTPVLLSAAGGAAAAAILGFTLGGWVTGSKSNAVATKKAEAAVVAALAPICLANFRGSANPEVQQLELKKVNTWEQGSFVEKAGWATMPGSDAINSALARRCATLILGDKS
jgi:hypothetical protein